jgi:hypothetical protein
VVRSGVIPRRSGPSHSSRAAGASGAGFDVAAKSQSSRGRVRALWWASIPVWSLGVLAFVPFFRRALVTRRRRDWLVTVAYLAGVIAEVVLVALGGDPSGADAAANAVGDSGGGLAMLLMGGGATHAWIVYRRPAPLPALPRLDGNSAALAQAVDAARRRTEARRILETDPTLARDLRIGRPDLPRGFDDGGLIDVNHCPAELLADAFGWTAAEAAMVVEARERAGGFTSPAELIAYTELDPRRIDAVADLFVFRDL